MAETSLIQRMQVAPVPRLALSLEEVAQAVGLCSKTVSALIHDGRLLSVRVGTRHLVPVSEIQRWLDAEAGQAGSEGEP